MSNRNGVCTNICTIPDAKGSINDMQTGPPLKSVDSFHFRYSVRSEWIRESFIAKS